MNDARAFLLADRIPGDHTVERRHVHRLHGGQLIEGTVVLPPDHLRALEPAKHLVLPLDDVGQCALSQVVRPTVLRLHLHVSQVRPHGGGDVAGERPRRRRPDEQRLTLAPAQREANHGRVVR